MDTQDSDGVLLNTKIPEPAVVSTPTDAQQLEQLAQTYFSNKSQANFDAVVAAGLGYVKGIATRVHNPIPQLLSSEDLIQTGAIGLIATLHRYDPAKKTAFRTVAYPRILGAMIDSIRQLSSTSRTRAIQMVPISDSEYQLASSSPTPEEILVEAIPESSTKILLETVQELPSRQRSVIVFLLNGIHSKQIAGLFDITMSKVQQERQAGLGYLRSRLAERLPDTINELSNHVGSES